MIKCTMCTVQVAHRHVSNNIVAINVLFSKKNWDFLLFVKKVCIVSWSLLEYMPYFKKHSIYYISLLSMQHVVQMS